MIAPYVSDTFTAAAHKRTDAKLREAGDELHKAIWHQDMTRVRDILMSPFGTQVLEYRDRFTNTPLLNAVEYGVPEAVRWLLDMGADKSAKEWPR